MPRLTPRTYFSHHLWLSGLIAQDPAALSRLSPRDQWHLHAYFRPTESLPAAELLAHRTAISKQRPSLPQSAGRALHALERQLAVSTDALPPQPAGSTCRANGKGTVVIYPTVRPHLDTDGIARALLRHALDKSKDQEREDPAA